MAEFTLIECNYKMCRFRNKNEADEADEADEALRGFDHFEAET
jgi:hypothetical protein